MGSIKINGKECKTVTDGGRERFPGNPIVRALLDAATDRRKLDLNDIWGLHGSGAFTLDHMHEFYRLIGYSVSGFGEVFPPPETLMNDEKAENYKAEESED